MAAQDSNTNADLQSMVAELRPISFIVSGDTDDDKAQVLDPEVPETLSDLVAAANNEVPAVTAIAIVDKPSLTPDDMQNLQDIQLLQSFINVLATKNMYDTHGAYDLNDKAQSLDFVVQYANQLNFAMTNSMGGYLNLEKASVFEVEKSITSAQIHTEVLSFLFKSMALPESALKELDALLTSVNQKLEVSLEKTKSDLNHVLMFFYFEKVQGLDVKVAKMRFLFLTVEKSTWSATVGKSTVGKFMFKMTQVDTAATMNGELVEKDRDLIQKVIHKMTGGNLKSVMDSCSPKVVTAK
eukprot:CAMPEP_0194305022 /NCGR_PEP_ID=MMETSP0171-20130528/2559_1 /TAXON_ID=218684 /ORGANISM="Corethron pennatum, Strain L29A3" /LENGTH=296 /DNA_ID=CAMNT_0039056427 /DNA_START=172 /DNA_END=1062 /DNA_ORIENTATION=-